LSPKDTAEVAKAKGEGDLQIYYDGISEQQNTYLQPALDKVLPVMALSAWGEIPEDFDYNMNSPRSLSPKDTAEVAKAKGEAILAPFNAGVYGRKTSLKEFRQLEDETGLFSNITDEMIEEADDDVQDKGEMMGALQGFKGGNELDNALDESKGPKKELRKAA
jgi:hypothetical protein